MWKRLTVHISVIEALNQCLLGQILIANCRFCKKTLALSAANEPVPRISDPRVKRKASNFSIVSKRKKRKQSPKIAHYKSDVKHLPDREDLGL